MYPNESGRDKAREIKNDRLSVNPKSPLWLRSLSCVSCPFATLNAFLYPRKPPVAQQVSGLARTLTALLTKCITDQMGTENGKSVFQSQAACLLCRSCLKWFYFTFGRLSIIHLQHVLQNGSGVWGDHGEDQAGFVTVEDFVLSAYCTHFFNLTSSLLSIMHTPEVSWGKKPQQNYVI